MVPGKKHLLGTLAAALLACCAPANQPVPGPSDDPATEVVVSPDPSGDVTPSQDVAQVLDKDGKLLCQIDAMSTCTAVDAGLFYGIFTLGENAYTGPAVYRVQLLDKDKHVSKKTINRQGYEPVFARTELGGNVYTLNLIGNPMDNEPDDLMLYGFLPSSNSIVTGRITTDGFPYAAMTVSGDKLLIMSHEMSEPKCDKIYAYDHHMIKEILSFPSGDESDSMRSIYGSEEGFYLLRLHIAAQETELFVDRYDSHYNKIYSKSLRSLVLEAAQSVGITKEDSVPQQGMHVAGFRVVDGRFVFYENFSAVRAIFDIQEEKVLFAGNDMYQLSTGCGRPLFYKLQFSPSDDADIVGIKDGAVEHIPYTLSGLLQGISTSPGGNCLYRLAFPTQAPSYVWTSVPQ
ncbi:MAG: hypothetical protein IKR15_03820 [Bacteroidales bacterium]|nr:hypothetical protein [Bacteroidales bacterium]